MKKGVIRKDKFGSWVEKLKEKGDVFGPKKKDVFFVFDSIDDPGDLAMDYPRTILPPKKVFIPPKDDVLLEFNTKTGTVTAPNASPDKEIILLGVHACDMQGLLRLDKCFEDGNPDNTYLARRAKSTLIGVTCAPDEFCFCSSVGSVNHKEGFDIFLSDIGDSYLAESFTGKGDGLLSLAETGKASKDDEKAADAARKKCEELKGELFKADVKDMPGLAVKGESLPFWEEIAKRCLACGTCTNVCPTCYCFDVRDNIELNLADGQRLRFWDSCQLEGFTEVAGGEKFTKDQVTRQKHRFYRKFRYLTEKHGGRDAFCVGCGRCREQCPAEISIVEIANNLAV